MGIAHFNWYFAPYQLMPNQKYNAVEFWSIDTFGKWELADKQCFERFWKCAASHSAEWKWWPRFKNDPRRYVDGESPPQITTRRVGGWSQYRGIGTWKWQGFIVENILPYDRNYDSKKALTVMSVRNSQKDQLPAVDSNKDSNLREITHYYCHCYNLGSSGKSCIPGKDWLWNNSNWKYSRLVYM